MRGGNCEFLNWWTGESTERGRKQFSEFLAPICPRLNDVIRSDGREFQMQSLSITYQNASRVVRVRDDRRQCGDQQEREDEKQE